LTPLLSRGEVPAPPTADEIAQINGSNVTVAAATPAQSDGRDGRPQTPAAAGPTSAPDFGGYRPGAGFGRYGGWGRILPADNWTDQDADAAAPWLKEHSPKRWQVVINMPDDQRPMRKYRLKGTLIRVYKNVQNLQKDDPELAQIVTNRVELEDAVFGLVAQYREAKRAGDTSKQSSFQHDIQQKVVDLVETNIKERKARIARLERTLDQERTKLATDEKGKDQLVEKRLHNLIDGQLPTPDELRGKIDAAADQVGAAQP
jgi:hypothetical protein